MSSPEPTGIAKRSPLFGVAKTRLRALDEGVKKTIENAIARYLEKRIEFTENLPEATRAELQEEGMLQAPTITLPGAQPAKPAAAPAPTPRMIAPQPPARSRI
jgi:hypothetical protein